MVTLVVSRKTGETKIVDSYPDPKDQSLEAIGVCLAKMIIDNGLLEKFNVKEAKANG